MKSLWQMTGPEIESDDFEGKPCDALVVGAGLTGLTTAVLLARAGQRVVVLEARRTGDVTTGNTTGKLSLLQGTTFSEILKHNDAETVHAYAEANREGQAWMLRQFKTWGVEVDRRTAYTYATDSEQLEKLESEKEAAETAGIAVAETLDPELPFATHGALMLKNQAQLHPMVMLAELVRELRDRGGELVERCRVRDVENQERAVEVTSDLGAITADVCVLHFTSPERITWWAAQDYRPHSRIPFAGALPRGGGRIYTATGYNKWGMTNAVAAALTISADILGGNLEWAQMLRKHSLSLPTMRDAIDSTAEVAARLVTGWAAAELRSLKDIEAPEEGEGVVARDGATPVGIARVDGRLCRVSAVCPHMGGIVKWNGAESSWDCPLHGSRFTADGRRLEGPAVDDIGA